MFRHTLPILIALICPSTFYAQDAAKRHPTPHRIPMMVDESGGFQLCEAKVDGKAVHLLVDSGAQVEVAMLKEWSIAQGDEFKEAGKADGIAGKSALFTTKFDSVDIGGAIELRGLTAHVMDLQLGIPFAKQADGTTPKVDGLLGSVFLMNAQAVINYADQRLEIPAKGGTAKDFLQQSLAAGKRIIPLVKGFKGAPYVPIRFGDKEYLFIIDNAAGSNVMLPEIAQEIGLSVRENNNEVKGVGGDVVKAKYGIADNVVVGNLVKLPKLDFMVMPSPGGDSVPEGARFGGILGNSFLKQLKVCLDFGSYQMILPALGKTEAPAMGEQVIPIKGADQAEAVLEGIFKKHYQEIPLTRSNDGHYFVEAKINGNDRWMCLDSGADGILLDRKIAKEDKIKLTPGGTATGADGKPMPSFSGTVKTFSVGGTSFNAATLTFLDLSHFSPVKLPDGTTHPSAGQLGLAYLRSLPIAVDFPKSRILLAKNNIKGGLSGVRRQTGDLTAPMVEDDKGRHYLVAETMGKKVLFLVDIGSRSCILFDQSAKDLKLETRDIEGSFNTLGTRGIPRKGATLSELKLGDHKVSGNVEVVVIPTTGSEQVGGIPVIGIMGCTMFEVFKSSIDFHTNEVTFNTDLFVKQP